MSASVAVAASAPKVAVRLSSVSKRFGGVRALCFGQQLRPARVRRATDSMQ